MNKSLLVLALAFAAASLVFSQNSGDESTTAEQTDAGVRAGDTGAMAQRGFGNQPIRVDANASNTTLIKKALGSTVYTLTPGDTYELAIKLETTERVTLVLPPDYRLELPYLGTYDARGATFSSFRARIIRDVKKRLPVAEYVDFVLTSPALFDVTIYGGVKTPGSVTVTSLNTVWETVVAAGGIKAGGSLRRIRLTRGEEIILCDLTRYARTAEASQNPLLRPGDTIFVPHQEIVVQVDGSVLYPDPYEMIHGETLADLLATAGGLRPGALSDKIEITRIGEGGLSFFSVPVEDAAEVPVQNGDRVHVPSVVETQATVLVEAALYGKPAEADGPRVIPRESVVLEIPHAPALNVLSVLDSFGGPTPLATAEEAVVYRGEEKREIPFDAGELWESRDPALNINLEPGDHLFIPMKKLAVVVAGEVVAPGAYPYATGATVSDYIGAAGGVFPETASLNRIFLVSETGERTLVNLTSGVEAGSTVFVDKNTWKHTTYVLNEADTVVGFAASVVALISAILTLIGALAGP